MDRLEYVRGFVDREINNLRNDDLKKFAYIHTYGVAQIATMLAMARDADVELATIAAMLHDVSLYAENCPHAVHAKKSADYARRLLTESTLFTEDEITIVCNVIAAHSDKLTRSDGKISEILKDADVLQHYLYNVNIPPNDKDKVRLYYLLETFNELHQK